MNTYPEHLYPNLYQEILKDYHFRFPKYSPIDYPKMDEYQINIDWGEKGGKN